LLPGPERALARARDLAFFPAHDAPAVHHFELDLARVKPASSRIVPAAGATSGAAWPRRAAGLLAAQLGRELVEFPGGHTGYILRPRAFAAALGTRL